MEYIVSRGFMLPKSKKEFKEQLRYVLWKNRLWPYDEVTIGNILYWYQVPTRSIVWKSRITNINKFQYDTKHIVKARLSKFGNFDPTERYYLNGPQKGYCFAWKIKPLQRIQLQKPDGFWFPQIGWLRVSGEIAAKWLSQEKSNPLLEIEMYKNSYKDLSDTERKAVIESRIGQGKFRESLIQFWKGCAVTKCKALELLKAAHIKPWRDSNNKERLDKYNGLLLIPNLDCAFDHGLISFRNDGNIMISSNLDKQTATKIGINSKMKISQVNNGHIKYLTYHRKHIFCGKLVSQ